MKVKQIYKLDNSSTLDIPLFVSRIKAGFPSPADDYKEKTLDLNKFLISHPSATFMVWVEGESMINANIHSGDLLIVDKSETAKNNDVVVAVIDSEFTVKRITTKNGKKFLSAENDSFPSIQLNDENDVMIWGVVTSVIHIFRKR